MNKLTKLSLAMVATAAVAMPVTTGAVPAMRGIFSVPQPDGTELAISLHGDEFFHYTTTADGYLLVGNADGSYCYASGVAADGTLLSSGIRAVNAEVRDAAARNFLSAINPEDGVKALRANRRGSEAASASMRIPEGPSMLFSDVPTTGKQPGLVLLVEYQDIKFKVENPSDYFNRMMNEKGFSENDNVGSARDFFIESSAGRFEPTFYVYGPVTAKHNSSYYAGADGTAKAYELAAEALRELDDEVDFSIFDTDGDGYIDNITVIYAGQGQASGGGTNTVWPHSANASVMVNVVVDGVRYDRYCCQNEWVRYRNEQNRLLNRPDGIGTFCHEFSHVLGLPDLYDTAGRHYDTPGAWSVMDYGPYNGDGCVPPRHSAYEAYCLGWTEPEEITGAMNCRLDGSGSMQSYFMATDKDNEFFMFEARDGEGWDSKLPATGMLVWHIDYDKRTWDRNTPNNNRNHMRARLVVADNMVGDSTPEGDAFPGDDDAVTSFTASTRPALKAWSGYDMELPVTDIVRDDSDRGISFKVKGGATDPDRVSSIDAELSGVQATIMWNAPGRADEVDRYEVSIYNEDEGIYESGMRRIVSKERSLKVMLADETNYSARVRAVSATGRSDWSDIVSFRTGEAGIADNFTDAAAEGPVEYFNLQGIRVAEPQAGQIVIRKQGNTATKTVVR